MSDGAGAGEAPTPLLASDEDFAAVLRDLADATSSLAAAARAKSRTIFPPFLAASPADTDLAVAVAGSGLETARVSLLLTYLGGTAAAKQLGTIGEPLPLLQVRLGADAAAADAADAVPYRRGEAAPRAAHAPNCPAHPPHMGWGHVAREGRALNGAVAVDAVDRRARRETGGALGARA